MTSGSSVHLLEADPDIGAFLTSEQWREAEEFSVQVRRVDKGVLDLDAMFEETGSFGAMLLDGMLLAQLQVGDRGVAQLLGPRDLLSVQTSPRSTLVAHMSVRAPTPSRLAILGRNVAYAAQRWPPLLAGLYARMGEQCDRVATQLAICQLPRVEDRVLAILWMLAESWGRVTTSGTVLPLLLTHDIIGTLIGARRPTVTLALGELTQRGAIVQQKDSWLLLDKPSLPSAQAPVVDPVLVERTTSSWVVPLEPAVYEPDWSALTEAVARLREQHLQQREQVREQLTRLRRSRQTSKVARERLSRDALRRRRAPS